MRQVVLGKRILSCRAEHPEWNANQIANHIGTSKTYTRRVLERHGALTTSATGMVVHPIKHAVGECIHEVSESGLRAVAQFARAVGGVAEARRLLDIVGDLAYSTQYQVQQHALADKYQ